MKHFFRQHVSAGLQVPPTHLREPDRPPQPQIPHELVLMHVGSQESYRLPVSFDASGVAESTWSIPQDAKLGDYQVAPGARRAGRDVHLRSGDFRVEQYRVPTMRAVIQPPARPLVRPRRRDARPVRRAISRAAGAANAPVRLRTMLEPRTPSLPRLPGFRLRRRGRPGRNRGSDRATTRPGGTHRSSATTGRTAASTATPAQVQPLTLDEEGAARATVKLPEIDGPQSLVAELEYDDAERRAAHDRDARSAVARRAQPRHPHRGLGRDAATTCASRSSRSTRRQAARGPARSRSTSSSATPTRTAPG